MTWMIVYEDGSTKIVTAMTLDLAMFEEGSGDNIVAILRI